MEIRKIDAMLNHNTCEVFFDNLEVPAENLIGDGGPGLSSYIVDSMNAERILIASESLGDARYFIRRASDYAKERVVFGRPIGQNQGVQFPIARAHAQTVAAELMVKKAAALFEAGRDCGAEANMGKMLAADAAWAAAEVLPADVRRLRLCARVRHRAQVARDAAVSDRADLHQHDPGLRRPARAGDAAVVLIDGDCHPGIARQRNIRDPGRAGESHKLVVLGPGSCASRPSRDDRRYAFGRVSSNAGTASANWSSQATSLGWPARHLPSWRKSR